MNFPNTSDSMQPSLWGWSDAQQAQLLAQIDSIAPILDGQAAESEALGHLTPDTFEALRPLRMSHIFVPATLGGAQMAPRHGIELLERISYWSGGAGWVSMVHASVGAMSAGYLPDSAVEELFAPGVESRFSGQGAPTGMLKPVEGGYLLTGKWSYASGFEYATHTHSAAFVDDGTGKPKLGANGKPLILCTHAPAETHKKGGNWDVLGLSATGSIDYSAQDVFIRADHVYPVPTVELRQKSFFSLGLSGLAATGHSAFAVGVTRRMLDELATFARAKTGRAGLLGESESFWEKYARAEARAMAARALLYDVWAKVEQAIAEDRPMDRKLMTLVHLAKSEVHEAGAEICTFAYRAAGGASLRGGVLQRLFREMMTATQHMTASAGILAYCGRDLLGLAEDKQWQLLDLV